MTDNPSKFCLTELSGFVIFYLCQGKYIERTDYHYYTHTHLHIYIFRLFLILYLEIIYIYTHQNI